MFKKILFKKLASIAVIALLSVSVNPQTASPPAEAKPGGLDERLGADDGAALALLFTANMRGNLDTCD
ncbi:MAG TPA: hypothetical protein VE262_25380 [Blastocatellia bacterium]|nr:hypothetical protein [Blastocatellia bacterium]